MANSAHAQCADLAAEAISLLQKGGIGSLSSAIRKLELIARLTEDLELLGWCNFQLGAYMHKLPTLPESVDQEYANELLGKLKELKISLTDLELLMRLNESGGGFASIEFIEETLSRFNRERRGNDGTYYRNQLQATLTAIANTAYARASEKYAAFSFGDIPRRQFDVIRERVDDLLLDVCPEAIEKFMSAYERLGSQSAEDWSFALTATRRVIKAVADRLIPPRDTPAGSRKLGEEQYVNRLWAFLDENLDSSSDKDLAKAHVDYLGSFIQKLNDKASKGVHTQVTHDEAVRAVLYTYLTLGDILEFSGASVSKALHAQGKIDINRATKEELTAVPGISSAISKEIIKRRAKRPWNSLNDLLEIRGLGQRTLERISAACIAVPR